MTEWTQRQYNLALAWLDAQWNEPDRSDHYRMMIGCEIRRVLAKEPGSIQPQDMKLTFKTQKVSTKSSIPQTREEAARAAKAQWSWMIGLALDRDRESEKRGATG